MLGQIMNGVAVPVPPHEQASLTVGKLAEEIREQILQLPLGGVGHPHGGGQLQDGLLQLAVLGSAAVLTVAVDGDVAKDGGQIGLDGLGTAGRDGSPELEVGVVDAFLGILAVASSQDAEGEVEAEAPVVPLGLGDGALVTLEV